MNFLLKDKTPREVINKLRNLISESSDKNSLIEMWAFVGLEVLENFFPENLSEIRVYYKNLVIDLRLMNFQTGPLLK